MEVSIFISLLDGGWAPPEGFWTGPERMDPKTLDDSPFFSLLRFNAFGAFMGLGRFQFLAQRRRVGKNF